MISPRAKTHTHTNTPLPRALDAPPQSNLFTLSRCCSCRRWGGSRLQSRKAAPEDERAKARGRPGSGTAAPPGAPGSPPPFLFPLPPSPSPPPPRPGLPQSLGPALPGRLYLRDESGEGGERPRAAPTLASSTGRAPHRPGAAAAAAVIRALRSAEEKATQRAESRGPAASEPFRLPPTPPARPGLRAAHAWPMAGAPGLGGGCPGAARARRRHLPGGLPRVRPGPTPVSRRREARPAGCGGTGGVTTLRAPRRLLGSSRALGDLCLRGTGLSFPVPFLCPPSPSRMLGSFSLLPVVQSRAALFNNPPAPPARSSRAALPEPPLPSQSCCGEREREADWQSVGDYLW